MNNNIFIITLELLKAREYAKLSSLYMEYVFDTVSRMIYDVSYYDGFFELYEWIEDRINKKAKYQNTGYLDEHAVIAGLWGALRVADLYLTMKGCDRN